MASCPHFKGKQCYKTRIFHIIIGISVGIAACSAYLIWLFVSKSYKVANKNGNSATNRSDDRIPDFTFPELSPYPAREIEISQQPIVLRKPLYVAVQTMEGFAETRAKSCSDTWGRSPYISKLQFFIKTSGRIISSQPMENLIEIEDSFDILDHLCGSGEVNGYDWFMLAMDDTYIRPDNLLHLLNMADNRKKLYIGHGIVHQGIDGENQRITYCLGGSGAILSRKALKGLCPHLSRCRSDQSEETSSDLQLGQCIHRHLNIECSRSSRFRELFQNSYERNRVSILEGMLREDQAVTLHPLKHDWMMQAVHRHTLTQSLAMVEKRLQDTKRKLERLNSYSKANTTWPYGFPSNSSSGRMLPTMGSRFPVKVVTSNHDVYDSQGCTVKTNMTSAERQEFDQAVLLANISCKWGNMLDCQHLFGGSFVRGMSHTNYTLHLQCSPMHNTSQHMVLSSVQLSKQLSPPGVTRIREKRISSRLVAMVTIDYGNPDLFDFLFMWSSLRHQPIESFLLVLLITQPSGGRTRHYTTRHGRHLPASVENTLTDINEWSKQNGIDVRTYYSHKTTKINKTKKRLLRELREEQENSVVLLTPPGVKFDQMFIHKCRALVRPGKQIYKPYSEYKTQNSYSSPSREHTSHTLTPSSDEINKELPPGGREVHSEMSPPDTMLSDRATPLCIHISDLISQNSKPRVTKSAKPEKPVKIIHALDTSLKINSF